MFTWLISALIYSTVTNSAVNGHQLSVLKKNYIHINDTVLNKQVYSTFYNIACAPCLNSDQPDPPEDALGHWLHTECPVKSLTGSAYSLVGNAVSA